MVIDAPGYGYAEKDLRTVRNWRLLLENYLNETRYLRCAISLVDSKVGLTDADIGLLAFINKLRRRVLVCLTKCDKSTPDEVQSTLKQLIEQKKNSDRMENYVFLTSGLFISCQRSRLH